MEIKTDADHAAALAELDRIWKTDPSREKALVAAIEAYEDIHYPIPEPTEEEMREFWEGQRAQEEKAAIPTTANSQGMVYPSSK